jgi:hypothetical protein
MKIHFPLSQDEEGYPPVAVESVWATMGETPGKYVIDNIPFFTQEATIGDSVYAREENGQYWFEGIAERSTNSLIRIVFFDPTRISTIGKKLTGLGCSIEVLAQYNVMAVSVSAEVELSEVQSFLEDQASDGSLDYEEPILRQP